jgi:hypothetical protein
MAGREELSGAFSADFGGAPRQSPQKAAVRETHMRSIIALGLAALAALLAGCQVVGYAGNPGFDNPFVNDTIGPTAEPFPTVFYFPDNTMYFFPIYGNGRPVSDLDLLAFRCAARNDGRLVVTALVENLGTTPVAPDWFRAGDLGAVRVAALVTTRSGERERINSTTYVPMTVGNPIEMTFTPTNAMVSDIVRIDMVADPDRVVPDPLRDNNVLSWQGTMGVPDPNCATYR